MGKKLTAFLIGPRSLRRKGFALNILTARELLEARAEAENACPDPESRALWNNACILARAVRSCGHRVFQNGEALLRCWSAERIGEEIRRYRILASATDISCGQKQEMETLMEELRQSPMERIRWRVLRAFSALPTEERARDMTEGDYLYCVMQMLLDQEEADSRLCPSCREKAHSSRCVGCGAELAGETGSNPQFDSKRFEELKNHG